MPCGWITDNEQSMYGSTVDNPLSATLQQTRTSVMQGEPMWEFESYLHAIPRLIILSIGLFQTIPVSDIIN
jgi:hypothetical protein